MRTCEPLSPRCVIKILSEGLPVWRYLTNEDRYWNALDLVIVILSLPLFPFEGAAIKLIRMVRLVRLVKILKRVPQLYIIVQGLIGGLKSMFYICVLMLLILYIYAIAGCSVFRENNPWHYNNIGQAFVTLFRAATLEDWTDIMYIDVYGCDKYKGHFGVYGADGYITEGAGAGDDADDLAFAQNRVCDSPRAQPFLAVVYWISYIVIVSLIMLSLFVGTVTMSMAETMDMMALEMETKKRKAALIKNMKQMV